MALQSRFPSVNPRLATYFAIFTSAVLSLFFVLAVIEQLGVSTILLSTLAILAPVLAACTIGLASSNNDTIDFFVSGRRVPPAYNGLATAAGSMGAVGILGLTGAVFFLGYDAIAIGLGWATGMMIMGVLFSPYLRKMGAYTLPGFFAQRFNSDTARLVCTFAIIFPVFMLLIAEIQIASTLTAIVFQQSQTVVTVLMLALICLALIGGGMRSLTWSQCAIFIIVIMGILAPLLIVSIQETNLPLPQLTFGSVLDDLQKIESAFGITNSTPQPLNEAIPDSQPTFTLKPFIQSFGLVSLPNFFFLGICFMIGAATLPGSLVRMSTTPTVIEARKSTAWALAFVALLIISVPAYAVFTKIVLLKSLPQYALDQLPDWITRFEANGIFSFAGSDSTTLDMQNLGISRDGVFLLLPYAAQFPAIMIILTVCTIMLAAVAAASSQLVTMSNMISHDIIYRFFGKRLTEKGQVNITRICLLLFALIAGWIAVNFRMDTFKMLAYAFSITGSAIFAPLALSIWWRGCNRLGAILGMLGGALTALTAIWLSENAIPILGIDGYIAGIIGFPVSLIITLGVGLTSSEPIKIQNEIVDDIRIPGGEAIYDRALRAQKRKQQKTLALE